MFGFGLEAKAKKILLRYFLYPVTDSNREIFDQVVHYCKSEGQNEYGVAIFFMIACTRALFEHPGDVEISESMQKDAQDFAIKNVKIMLGLRHKAKSPDMIQLLIKDLLIKTGLAEADTDWNNLPSKLRDLFTKESDKGEREPFNAEAALEATKTRGNYLNAVYSEIGAFIDAAGVPISTPLLEQIHKETEDSGEVVDEAFTWHKLIGEVLSEVAYANGDYLYNNFTIRQAAAYTVSMHISALTDDGRIKDIKKDQPDMYDTLQKLWFFCGFLATDEEAAEEYKNVIIVPKSGNPFT